MYELLILSILMRNPAHGYLIAKIINDSFGPYIRVSNGRLYPLLAKFEETGLIEAFHDPNTLTESGKHRGTRPIKSYRILEAGRKRFHELMMDTSSYQGEYQQIFWHKSVMFDYIEPQERLNLIDHYLHYCQGYILHLRSESEDLKNVPFKTPRLRMSILNVMNNMANHWHLEVEWVQRLKEQVLADLKHEQSTPDS